MRDEPDGPAEPDEHEHPEPGYTGPAEVILGERVVPVRVELRGFFQPIDGLFHWYGRIAANPELDALVPGRRADIQLRTPEGERPGTLSDPDPWGRFRVTGESTPPFRAPFGADLTDVREISAD